MAKDKGKPPKGASGTAGKDKAGKDKAGKDKGGKDKGGKDKAGKAGPAGDQRVVELVQPDTQPDHRPSRIGLALLASLVIGFDPLRDAATGIGSFPGSMARYLACLAVSVGAVLLLGRLLDGAPPPPEETGVGAENGSDPPVGEDQRVGGPDQA